MFVFSFRGGVLQGYFIPVHYFYNLFTTMVYEYLVQTSPSQICYILASCFYTFENKQHNHNFPNPPLLCLFASPNPKYEKYEESKGGSASHSTNNNCHNAGHLELEEFNDFDDLEVLSHKNINNSSQNSGNFSRNVGYNGGSGSSGSNKISLVRSSGDSLGGRSIGSNGSSVMRSKEGWQIVAAKGILGEDFVARIIIKFELKSFAS